MINSPNKNSELGQVLDGNENEMLMIFPHFRFRFHQFVISYVILMFHLVPQTRGPEAFFFEIGMKFNRMFTSEVKKGFLKAATGIVSESLHLISCKTFSFLHFFSSCFYACMYDIQKTSRISR